MNASDIGIDDDYIDVDDIGIAIEDNDMTEYANDIAIDDIDISIEENDMTEDANAIAINDIDTFSGVRLGQENCVALGQDCQGGILSSR